MSLFHTTIVYTRAGEPGVERTVTCELDSPVWPTMPGYTALLHSFLVGFTRAEHVASIVSVGAVRLDMRPDEAMGRMRPYVIDIADRNPSDAPSFETWCGGRARSRFADAYTVSDVLDAVAPNVFADVRPLTWLGVPLDAWIGSLQAAAPVRLDAGEVMWAAYTRRFARTARLLRVGDVMAGGTVTMHILMPYNDTHSFDEAAVAHVRYAAMLRATVMAPLGVPMLLVNPNEGPLSRVRSMTLLMRSWERWRGADPSMPDVPDDYLLDRLWGFSDGLGGSALGPSSRANPRDLQNVWHNTHNLYGPGPFALNVLGRATAPPSGDGRHVPFTLCHPNERTDHDAA